MTLPEITASGTDNDASSLNDKKMRKKSNNGGSGNSGGFQSMGLSEEVYRGIMKMGFRVRFLWLYIRGAGK